MSASKDSRDPTGGFDKFRQILGEFSTPYVAPAYQASKRGETLKRPTDKAFETILKGFIEISDAMDSLRLIENVITHTAPRSQHVDKEHYLKFLIGSHLQALYILEQRMKMYGTRISRIYDYKQLIEVVQTLVYKPLEGLLKTRNTHVHERHYQDSDLERLSMLAMCLRDNHPLGEDFAFEYTLLKKDWIKRIKKNNDAVFRIADRYFHFLQVFMVLDGKLFIPTPSTQTANQKSNSK